MKRSRLGVVALLAIVFPSLSQAADAKPVKPGADIIGGGPASPGEYPFVAAILDERSGGTDYTKQFCGGSLIHAEWVLTAAHCVEGADPDDLAVAVGRRLLNSNEGQRRDIAQVVVHDDFGVPTGLAHDAALLRLASPVTGITPIRLAASTPQDDLLYEQAGKLLTVIGWGTISTKKASYPNDLREVDVPVVDDGTCRGVYGASLHAPTMVCAGAPNIDSCYGDSGGPLFDYVSKTQVGIVSWGNGCAKRRFPGVYSEVNSGGIRSWITANTGV
ncbi:MAG TPA: serine protease [Acidimicrobiia bacterium]